MITLFPAGMMMPMLMTPCPPEPVKMMAFFI